MVFSRTVTSLLLACGLLAGCGGGATTPDEASFSHDYGQAADQFADQMAAVQVAAKTALQSRATDSQATVFGDMQAITDKALRQMSGLTAPASASDAFGDVRRSLEDQHAALRQVLSSSAAGDAPALDAALQLYAKALTAWRTSATSLDSTLGRAPARAGPHA